MLVEAALALGLAAVLALLMLRGSLLAISGNQWTVLQTLTDAYLTRETALAGRIPLADLTRPGSAWPDAAVDEPPQSRATVQVGKIAGGSPVTAELVRFRVNETGATQGEAGLSTWRLHSVLVYEVAGKKYTKSRTTLRTQ